MSFLKPIVACLLVSAQLSWGFAQQAELPPAAALPVASVDTPTAASEALRGQSPNGGEMVSILKRRLPVAGRTVPVKESPEWFQNMMQRIVRENVPDKYVKDKDWGKTDKRWDGLKVRRKGLKLSTKRRWKEVNHGTWKRYEIRQVAPGKNLLLRIENVHDAGNGKVGFEVDLSSKVRVLGRTAKWAKGVQIYSVSAEADADVRIRLACQVGMRLDLRKFPPDVLLVPEVTRADLDVIDFHLDSLSKLDGPVVKQLGKSVHKVLLDEIKEKRDRLPEKINRQIAKNQDKLRFSISDFASEKWKTLTANAAIEPED